MNTLHFCLLMIFTPLLGTLSAQNTLITQYKTGIDLTLSGTQGVDWDLEYHYHDPKTLPRKVITIRDTTLIGFQHNERNVWRDTGNDYDLKGGDLGQIRVKVDGDMHRGLRWGGGFTNKPFAYTAPFSFADLTYADYGHPAIPVIDSTGPVPGIAATEENLNTYYWRGITGPHGEEWHTLSIGDDDTAHVTPGSGAEWQASDGHIISFIVNPQSPAIRIEATGDAEFYTTPHKTYYVPKIHDQTTYLDPNSGNISITLTDLQSRGITYQINSNTPVTSPSPVTLNATDFTEGQNTLTWSTAGSSTQRTRSIVRNPAFPSRNTVHGDRFWGGAHNWPSIKSDLNTHAGWWLDQWFRGGNNNPLDSIENYNQGLRTHTGQKLTGPSPNAILARYHGAGASHPDRSISWGGYALRGLLESNAAIDPVGFEIIHTGQAKPSMEFCYRGYYDANDLFEAAFAYDVVAGYFREDQHPDGMTPVQDHLIRDFLASYVHLCLLEQGGFVGDEPARSGMWDVSRRIGAFAIMGSMPDYSTSYYGTSGLDGNTTTYPRTPFQDDAYTWKQLFTDHNLPRPGWPNLTRYFGIRNNLFPSDPDGSGPFAAGDFDDRVFYTGSQLMGHCLGYFGNLWKLFTPEASFPGYPEYLRRCADGTLLGRAQEGGPTFRSNAGVQNAFFPEIRSIAQPKMLAQTTNTSQSLGRQLQRGGPLYTLWYNHEITDVRNDAAIETSPVEPASSASYTRDGGTITWTFDSEYQVGQYWDGTPFVIAPEGLTVTAISPTWDGQRNGSMLNVIPDITNPYTHGFDTREGTYEAAKNVGDDLPLTLSPGDCLVSARGQNVVDRERPLADIGALFVLAETPPADSFRPPYAGATRQSYGSTSRVHFSAFPRLSAPSESAYPNLNLPGPDYAAATGLDHIYLDIIGQWPNSGLKTELGASNYGRDLTYETSKLALWLCLDFPDETKRQNLIAATQFGIDVQGLLDAGMIWAPNGGHNGGRKLMLGVAARALGDSRMLAALDGSLYQFQEDGQHEFLIQRDVDIVQDGDTPFTQEQLDNWNNTGGPMPEWFSNALSQRERDLSGAEWGKRYRTVNGGPNIGTAIAAELLNLRPAWNDEAFFQYLELRYWPREEVNRTNARNKIQIFPAAMWDLYKGSNTPPEKPNATNTGSSGTLTPSGSITVTQDGAVIENLHVSGRIKVEANNVIIRNCLIDGGSTPAAPLNAALYCIQANSAEYSGLLIEDCEIRGGRSANVIATNFTMRRCNLWNSASDAIKPVSNFVIERCWIHQLGSNAQAHADGVQMTGGSNGIIRWNHFDMPKDTPNYNNSQGIIGGTQNGALDNIEISNNWINGGGWSVNIGHKPTDPAPTNIRIINNLFGRDFRFGPITGSANHFISGNRWEDTGELLDGQSTGTPPADTQAPTVPTNLNFEDGTLTWNASTDNTAVTIYQIFSNESPLQNSTSTSSSLSLAPGTYELSVSAQDAAGNTSPQSASLSVTVSEPSTENHPSGLIAHWPLDTDARDLMGNHPGTIIGTPTFETGQITDAARFTPSDQRVDLGNFNLSGNQLTIATWVNTSAYEDTTKSTEARLLSKATGTSSNDHLWMLGLDDGGVLRFRLKTTGSTTTLASPANQVPLNQWTHLAATYDGTSMNLFINGTEVASVAKTGNIAQSNAPVSLGNQPTGTARPLDGLIDDVQLYQRALNASELQAVANPGPFALWRQNHYLTPDDRDGLNLFLEYAFDLDPNTHSPNPIRFDSSTMSFSYDTPRSELTYTPEYSLDLKTWIPTNPGGDKVFMRVSVSD